MKHVERHQARKNPRINSNKYIPSLVKLKKKKLMLTWWNYSHPSIFVTSLFAFSLNMVEPSIVHYHKFTSRSFQSSEALCNFPASNIHALYHSLPQSTPYSCINTTWQSVASFLSYFRHTHVSQNKAKWC